ncbi:MAG: energy transducer TonB [Gammaproteobacteria bacterium]|nr:energy transducer TonB [Gammaproteobacteria bacterium]NNF61299.1 energy transducer TonB [Gammaproteobacteria bacterium]NNM20857.1 energy transducer TonB [Gammaproteobacteria bacterium]
MRLVIAPVLGALLALALFAFSNALISDAHLQQLDRGETTRLEFIRALPEERVFTKKRQLPQKQPPPKAPPAVDRIRSAPTTNVAQLPVQIEMPEINIPVAGGVGPYLGSYTEATPGIPLYDGDLVPLVQVSPRYPRHAAHRGVEGWVNVEFTIAADGTVEDPVVLAAEPPNVFNNSAINAIVRWKFKPRVVDGKPVASRGRQRITFEIVE